MSTRWFVRPIGRNPNELKNRIADELNRRQLDSEPQKICLTKGRPFLAYEIASDMANWLKNERVNLGLKFKIFSLKDGAQFVTEDKFIYGGGSKRKPSKKVIEARLAVQDLIDKKNKGL